MYSKRLDALKGEIRLLCFLPADYADDLSEPVRCYFEYATLFNPPPFTALSYVWGSADDTRPVVVGNSVIDATCNLSAALRRLRDLGVQRAWADAICINQDDLQERSEQVLRIGVIYRQATNTIAWLPCENDTSEPIVDHMKLLQDNGQSKSSNVSLASTCQALAPFFSNSYWRRLWIIQELALSRDVEFLYGAHSLPLSLLEDVVKIISKVEPFPPWIEDTTFQHIVNLLRLRNQIRALRPVPLLRALQLASACESTERRDRVYGLLGLVYDAEAYLPIPTYTESMAQISLKMARSRIESTKSLDTIALLANPRGDGGLPTWVTDWFSQDTWANATRVGYLTEASKFSLSPAMRLTKWESHGTSPPDVSFSPDGQVLITKGCILGVVSRCTSSTKNQTVPVVGQLPDQGQSLPSHFVCKALYYLFTLSSYRDGTIEDGSSDYLRFRHMRTTGTNRKELQKRCPTFDAWLSQNESFEIFGHSLATWIRFRTTLKWGLVRFAMYLVFGTYALPCLLTFWVSETRTGLSEWQYERIESVMDLDMRLAYGDFGIGWINKRAQPGDSIAVLMGCSMPVVLRKRQGGGWSIVGDAIVYGAMDGERMSEEKCRYIDIH